MKQIDAMQSVNEIVREHPVTVSVFNEYGIDACCGGASPLAEAAARDGAVLEDVLEALARCIAQAT